MKMSEKKKMTPTHLGGGLVPLRYDVYFDLT